MKTMTWTTGALAGLLTATAAVFATKEPLSTDIIPAHVTRLGEMSVERAAHQATLLRSGQVLITGGCADRCESVHSSVELYDPVARSFTVVAPLATPRVSHASVALPNGRVLVTGGWTGQSATASAEVYDPATGRWTSAGEMTEARVSPIATLLPGGHILITGGEAAVGAPLASAEILDPVTLTFSAVRPMHAPRTSHVALLLADGDVLIAGGHRARGDVLRSAEIFDPDTREFQPTGDMLFPRHKHAAALRRDGKVLLIGGSNARDFEGRYSSTEIFDPATGEFSAGPDMLWPRHKLRDAVAVLPSGAVLVTGGATQPELYDPVRGVFATAKGQLAGPQMFATATLLPAGNVLVLGGYDDRIQSSTSAWQVSVRRTAAPL